MRLATIRIRHDRTGRFAVVNMHEWARDLGKGKWAGWSAVGRETHGDPGAEAIARDTSPEQFEEVVIDIPETPVAEEEETQDDSDPEEEADEEEIEDSVMNFGDALREISTKED